MGQSRHLPRGLPLFAWPGPARAHHERDRRPSPSKIKGGTYRSRASMRPRLPWGAVFIVADCSLVFVFATAGVPIPLYNVYRTENGISNADLGIVSAGYFVAAAASLLLLG